MGKGRFIGSITVKVFMVDGDIDAEHETTFGPETEYAHGTMTNEEKRPFLAKRKKILADISEYFLAIDNPDHPLEIER